MELQNRISAEDRAAVQKILEQFKTEQRKEEPDRNTLATLAKKAFDYEMKYLPQEEHPALKKLPSRTRGLLVLVGNRPEPILLSLAVLKPQKTVLIHTRDSQETTHKIQNANALQDHLPQDHTFVSLPIDPLNSSQTYRDLVQTIQNDKINWICDITGGKKAMGAALAAFGFWRRLPVVYLDSVEVRGIPEPFSERLHLLENPYDRYGDPLLQTAEKSLSSWDFQPAIGALCTLRETTSFPEQYHKTEQVLKVLEVYQKWDRFEHSNTDKNTAKQFFQQARETFQTCLRLRHTFVDPNKLQNNLEFLTKLEETYEDSKSSLQNPYRLIDLFCNAERKKTQHSFDDATARCYRCIEMAATLLLRQLWPDFRPNAVNWNDLRKSFLFIDLDSLYAEFAKPLGLKYESLPKDSRIGLAAQITLAATIAKARSQQIPCDPPIQQSIETADFLFEIYKAGQKKQLWERRNRSILAHGTDPIDQETFEEFCTKTREICIRIIGKEEWNKWYEKARFPAFKLTDQ